MVKELIEMELKQRKKDGDTEGFEAGSEHWLKFNIWKVEQDWKKNKRTIKPKQRALWRLLTISTSLSLKRRPQSKTKERKIPKAFEEAMRGRGT